MRLRLLGAVAALIGGIALLASVAAAATPMAAAAAGGIGVRLLAPPGDASANPLAHSYLVGVVAPGTSIRRRVEVDNSTRQTVNVAVYSGAASIRRGLFAFASGRRRNDLARWTSVSSPLLHLSPGGKALVTLTVNVPLIASSGEHYAVVWAELAAPANGGVRLVNRVGVRLYVTVGPGGTAPANFTIGRLSAARSAGGAPLVRATLRNNGPRTLLVGGKLTLSNGPGGSNAGPFPATLLGALSPGGTAEVRVQLDPRLPRGPWTAHLRLHSGPLERVAAARLTFPRAGPVAEATGGWRRHLVLVLVLLNILGAAAVAVLVAGGRVNFLRGRAASQ